jgi:predicted kinase
MMRGVSGSGKSFIAQQISDRLPAISVRSDVERKRLLGLAATADANVAGGYDESITKATYAQLVRITEQVSAAGYVVVVDATFLKRSQREPFLQLSNRLGLPLIIVDCDAPVDVLERRVTERAMQEDNVSDATHAVLAHQLATREPLKADEGGLVLKVGPARPLDWEALVAGVS